MKFTHHGRARNLSVGGFQRVGPRYYAVDTIGQEQYHRADEDALSHGGREESGWETPWEGHEIPEPESVRIQRARDEADDEADVARRARDEAPAPQTFTPPAPVMLRYAVTLTDGTEEMRETTKSRYTFERELERDDSVSMYEEL